MEVGLRDQLERITKESRLLKQKAEVLEKENALLKKSIFDLSLKYNAIAYQQAIHPIELDDGSLKLMNPTNLDSGVITQKALLLETMASASRDKYKESKFFVLKSDLKEHSGAVYTVQFSPCGKWLASGSFDKTIRIWDTTSTPKEVSMYII
ncbi:hypothetical protein HMI56_002017 [Coelomomyces lativittatus]|nr:hypothetical protein HMI56_002017 [Coelomomyces lativittatus]